MAMFPRIRPATAADIPVLQRLASESPGAAQWSPAHYEGLFEPSSPARVVLVIEDGVSVDKPSTINNCSPQSEIRGFLIARGVANEWEIENIAVAPIARRRGIGGRLLREALCRAKNAGVEAVFLEVRASNLGARALYEKCGFRETGRRVAYYQQPMEDAVAYRLIFP